MVQINSFFSINKMYRNTQLQKLEVKQKEDSLLEQGGGLDTVSFSKNKSEKFADVRKELDKNVPDRTTTIEEKEKALSYIERMLKCDDITPEMKNYWTNKKNVIEMEIQSIKNEQQVGKNEKWDDIAKEFSDFTDKYWVENVLNNKGGLNKLKFNDAQEYYNTVRRTMIIFCDRILACSDLPDDMKEYYSNLKNGFKCDLNYYATQQNEYNKAHNQKTESFNDVFAEMRNNIPDSTSTINEKQLALSYIERMLSCDDIPNPEYWQNKRDIIEMEIESIKNSEATQYDRGTTPYKKVQEEYNKFAKKYWNKNPKFNNIQDRVEYWITYNRTCKSYIRRILKCNDLPNDMRKIYMSEYSNHQFDIDNHLRDLERYRQEQSK